MKVIRTSLGLICVGVGIVFAILPGSILFLIGGFTMLAFDYAFARRALSATQKAASNGARRLDKWVYKRKLR